MCRSLGILGGTTIKIIADGADKKAIDAWFHNVKRIAAESGGNEKGIAFFSYDAVYAISMGEIKKKYPNAEDMPQQLRDEFRAGSLPLMKYTNWLTHNSRAFTLYVVCLLNVPYVYPLFEIVVLGVMYLYMHKKHEELSERMMERL